MFAIFILLGELIAVSATAFGVMAAFGAAYLLEHYIPIELPDVYYVSHVPAHMTVSIALVVFCLVIILSFFALWLPVRQLKTINIARTFRKFT